MPTPAPYTFPFDPSGVAPSNYIGIPGAVPPDLRVQEVQTITAVNANEYHIVIPNFAPFYRGSLQAINGNTMTPLIEGVDFLFSHKYKEATINTAQAVYGSITLLNKAFAGVLILKYQTVGGQWTLSTTQINQILMDKVTNPRITTWEQVGAAPEHFPVINHLHVDPEELIGMPELVAAIESIGLAIAGLDVDIDYSSIYAYADSKVQNSLTPGSTTVAPSVDAVVAALNNLQVGVHIGPTPPINAVVTQLWWNNTIGRMFIYYSDGDSTQWVETSPGSGGSGTSARIHVGTTAPVDPVENQLWWNNESLRMFIYYKDPSSENNLWVEVVSTGSQTAIIYVGPSAPASPIKDQLWWSSDLGRMFIYYQDDDGYQWVETNPNNSGADGILPVGSVIQSFADAPPTGFLHCRGEEVQIAAFPDLYDTIGTKFNLGTETSGYFRLPNLQGQFLRGYDVNAGIDEGRDLGDNQKGSLSVVDFNTPSVVGLSYGDGSGETGATARAAVGLDEINATDYEDGEPIYVRGAAHSAVEEVTNLDGAVASLADSTVGAVRPTNVSVNYFIKAYSAVQNPGEVQIPTLVSQISGAEWKLAVQADVTVDVAEIETIVLPTSTKMVRIVLSDVSFVDASGDLAILLSTSSGYHTTLADYKGRLDEISQSAGKWGAALSAGAMIYRIASGTEDANGIVDLVRAGNSDIWGVSGQLFDDQNDTTHVSMGVVKLPAAMNKLKLFISNGASGSQKIAAGKIAIWYL